MTPNDLLIQSLIAAGTDTGGVYLDDSQYLDWSNDGDNDGPRLEVGDADGNVATIDLSRDDVARIQRALTLWLLDNPA
jgi:hypothetical protein